MEHTHTKRKRWGEVKLETKYDLGQEVYYVRNEYTVKKGEVITIYFDGLFNNIPKYEIEYNGNVFCEDDVFLTKEEAEKTFEEMMKNDKRGSHRNY